MVTSLENHARISQRIVQEIRAAGLHVEAGEPQIIVAAMVQKPPTFVDLSGTKAKGVVLQWVMPMKFDILDPEKETQFVNQTLSRIPFLKGTLNLIGKGESDAAHGKISDAQGQDGQCQA